ncbi:MAG: hypothetical protein KIT10_04860 [Flavobacteriales bacterium]|nr:hypothetical protein [Flavobacteriales bacterium]
MRTILMALLAILINTVSNAQCDPGCCTPEEWPICAPLCALATDDPLSVEAITAAINEAGADLEATAAVSAPASVDCPTRPGCVCPGSSTAPARDARHARTNARPSAEPTAAVPH